MSVPAMRAGKDVNVTSPYVWKAVPLNLAHARGQVNAIVHEGYIGELCNSTSATAGMYASVHFESQDCQKKLTVYLGWYVNLSCTTIDKYASFTMATKCTCTTFVFLQASYYLPAVISPYLFLP